jgi:hypothetical protein
MCSTPQVPHSFTFNYGDAATPQERVAFLDKGLESMRAMGPAVTGPQGGGGMAVGLFRHAYNAAQQERQNQLAAIPPQAARAPQAPGVAGARPGGSALRERTLLTGPGGVPVDSLTLGKSSLLGS